jgi:hypothetical protein
MRNIVHSVLLFVSVAAAAGWAAAGCRKVDALGDGDPDAAVDADADTDTDTDTDTGTTVEEGWEGISISSIDAPDEYTVFLVFDGAPPAADAADAAIYALSSDVGGLAIDSAAYDEDAHIATLTTARQKLGATYTLTITPPVDTAPLTADFPSADLATFWVYGWVSGTYEQITAERAQIGDRCVVYIQDGYSASTAFAVSNFDENVYPIETGMFIDAPDMDGNGKIVMLGLDGAGYYAGYFDPLNAYTESQAVAWGGHSNEMEIIHIDVSYFEEESVVPHEFQHLLYQERHGENWDWTYHNEGLAECAVRAVTGGYQYAIDFYFWDYQQLISQGLSLVDWNYSLYENYVVAFLFWSYVAAQLDGIDTYSAIFDLDTGSPEEVNGFLLSELGLDFADVQLDQMIAAYVQAETGVYGYEGLLELGDQTPPHALAGDTSYDLEPFAGTYFQLDQATVDYPGTQGANVVYAGIDGSDAVDLEAPFDIEGGALVVLNANFEFSAYPTEHSGPDVAAASKLVAPKALPDGVPAAWRDPPPRNPANPAAFDAWLAAAKLRLGAE